MNLKRILQPLYRQEVKKYVRIMRLIWFLILALTLQTNANLWSQTTKMDIKVTNQTLLDLFSQIENNSEYRFFYSNDEIDVNQKISIEVEEMTIGDVLTEIFKDLPYSFKELRNKMILVELKDDISLTNNQRKTIYGKVTDSSNKSLPGVTIVVKGTTQGTVTDLNGKYVLPDVTEGVILQFSFVGMKTKEVLFEGQEIIDVVMTVDAIGLEEVVAIGYGTVKKSDLTGSITSIKKDDFNQGAIISVDQAMQGRIAGVQVTQASSEPGGGLSIRIRGASSVNAGNEPLYVIDGLPIDNSSMMSSSSTSGTIAGVSQNYNTKNPLNSLNPNDIESIEVLKDASATAIYGSRGANGVVLITTKKGSGGIKFNYDGYGGVQTVAKKIDVLSTSEYIEAINTLSTESGDGIVFSDEDILEIGDGTDWQDEIYETAMVQSHNLSMSGRAQKTKFYVSLNYFDQEGVVMNSGIERYIARINLEQEIGKKLKFGLNINTSRENSDNYIGGVNTNEEAGPVNAALLYDPTLPVYDETGDFYDSPDLTINNPMSLIKGISSQSVTNRIFGNMTLDYKIFEGLNAKINLGIDNQNGRRDIYNSTKTILGSASNGIANIASRDRSNFLVEYTMNYSKTFNENNSLNVLGGITYQDFITKSFSAGTSGFPADDIGVDNLELGDPSFADISSGKYGYTLLSYLARANYSYYNFLITASIRADGSSRFGENNKFGYFPSFALGWKLSEEDFIPELFSELKLRTSWGQTGNQEISNYQSLSTYTDGGTAILDGNAYVGTKPSRIANPDLKWETTEQLNIGLDFGFLKGRITGSLDYFNKKTSDMLLYLPLPVSSGFSYTLKNIGSMENKGVEFMINSRNIVKNDFSWLTTFNISSAKNEVTSLGSLENINTSYIQSVGNTTIITPGQPLNSYYGYRIIGIFQDEEEIENSVQPDAEPGYPKFDNVNNDDKISTDDQVILGNPFPGFTFGLRNSITYGNFNFDFFFQGQYGADLLNVNAIESMYPANPRRNRITAQYNDRWTENNRDAKWPSGINTSSYDGGKVNSLVIEDASYIRLKSIQLTYDIPIKVSGIHSAKVYVLGQNLFTITDYTGYDPEANAFGRSNSKIDYNAYPLSRTWILGLNIQF